MLIGWVSRQQQDVIEYLQTENKASAQAVGTLVSGLRANLIQALPTILAEEFEIDPRRIVVEMAPVNSAFQDPLQITRGSTSVNARWDILRTTGAQAREMLVAAAAARWGVEPD